MVQTRFGEFVCINVTDNATDKCHHYNLIEITKRDCIHYEHESQKKRQISTKKSVFFLLM